MNRLGKRLERIEAERGRAGHSPVNIIFIRFVSPEEGPEGPGRLGLAMLCKAPGGQLSREEGESEDAFLMRSFSLIAPDGPPEKLKGDDLVTFLAARDPAIARADIEKSPITDDMLQRAMAACAETP